MARSQLQVTFDAPTDTPLSILSRTLEDFDTHLELVLTLVDPRRDSVPIPKQWRARRHSRLPTEEQPLVGAISKGSPLVVDLVVGAGAAGAFTWALVQAIEKAMLLPNTYHASKLNVQSLQLGVELQQLELEEKQAVLATRRDLERAETPDAGDPVEIEQARQERDLRLLIVARNAEGAWRQSENRLSQDLPIVDVAQSTQVEGGDGPPTDRDGD